MSNSENPHDEGTHSPSNPSGESAQQDPGQGEGGGSVPGLPSTARGPGNNKNRNVWPHPAQQGKAIQYIRNEDNPLIKISRTRLLKLRQHSIEEKTQSLIKTVSGHAGQPRGSVPQRRPKPNNTITLNRNTNRGLRNTEKVKERKENRTMKRAIARRAKRQQNSCGEASAQEASRSNKYKTQLNFLRYHIKKQL